MSILVWAMVGIAIWHFTVLLPDRFYGGIIGAFLAALGGALLAGYMLPAPGVPDANPPGCKKHCGRFLARSSRSASPTPSALGGPKGALAVRPQRNANVVRGKFC